ncbi:MAG: Calx-beta domain-containing protein, partial [Dehalococcoidia bacterium]
AHEQTDASGISGWTQVAGASWQPRGAPPVPIDGDAYFYPGSTGYAELIQDIDVSAYAETITAGRQWFVFGGWTWTLYEAPTDTARVIVEFRDLNNRFVLDDFDTGAFSSPSQWLSFGGELLAPGGTGWIRVRLISTDLGDAYFDALDVRSVRAAMVTVDDIEEPEGHRYIRDAVFTVRLACPTAEEVRVDFMTADGTAIAGQDYLAELGTVSFQAGETASPITVGIVGDEVDEPHESFSLNLSLVEPTDALLLDAEAMCTIVNDDFCPRSPVFWMENPGLWLTSSLVLGDVEYDQATLLLLLSYSGSDVSHLLARELIATQLNLLSGSNPSIVPTADQADLFLATYPPGSRPKGADKKEGRRLRDALEAYNTTPCP